MYQYYFTYLMHEYGKENFNNLTNKILSKGKLKGKIEKFSISEDWLFLYFCSVYYTITLNYLGLNQQQIDFFLDVIIAPGFSKIFNPKELLEKHSDVIPEIEGYIKKELKEYYS